MYFKEKKILSYRYIAGPCLGDGKLSVVGGKGTQSVSASPSPAARRKQGEFLRVTESSPLIDPSEVTVETTQVHFAKIICSPYGTFSKISFQNKNSKQEAFFCFCYTFYFFFSV